MRGSTMKFREKFSGGKKGRVEGKDMEIG